MDKNYFPLNKVQLARLAEQYGTPFYIYDEEEICKNFRLLANAFKSFSNFKVFFSVKACPNPYILKILKKEGSGASCSTLSEIILAENAGFLGEDIFFTTNESSAREIIYGNLKNCLFNLDDISHIDFLEKTLGGIPEFISICYNSIFSQEKKQEGSFGLSREQVFQACKILQEKGVQKFGLHVNLAEKITSDLFLQSIDSLFTLMVEIKEKFGVKIQNILLGIHQVFPRDIKERNLDYESFAKKIKAAYDKILLPAELNSTTIALECGSLITEPFGYLVSKVLYQKSGGQDFIKLDYSIPELIDLTKDDYNIFIVDKEKQNETNKYIVLGSVTENYNNCIIETSLPHLENGELIIINNMGSYSRAKESNYKGKLRSGELLLRRNGTVIPIRRQETLDDYFSTIDFVKLKNFNV